MIAQNIGMGNAETSAYFNDEHRVPESKIIGLSGECVDSSVAIFYR